MRAKPRQLLPKFQRQQVIADRESYYLLEMPVEDWVALEGHPRQRDTEKRARSPHWELAREATGPALAVLASVTAGELAGRRIKVDGHTRALLWSTGGLPDPGTVTVTVYRCADEQHLLELYEHFDSPHASKKTADTVDGALRDVGVKLTSKRLNDGIADALGIAWRGVARSHEKRAGLPELDVYGVVKHFARELEMLDAINPPNQAFYSGVLGGALIALALDPRSIEFFKLLITADPSDVKPGFLSPADALRAELAVLKGLGSARIKAYNETLAGQTLSAVEAWRHGPGDLRYWISGHLEPLDLQPLVARVQARPPVAGPSEP